MSRHALVVSPTPSHPPDHGNRRRVQQTTMALHRQGYAIDFVLYPMDDDWQRGIPAAARTMQRAWRSLTIVPPSRALHQKPAGLDHVIDEWWDEALEHHLAWLLARQRYDVMLVNYVFLSRACTLAPPGCVRVLDTHDRLSGRRALFERHGETPEFFHTTDAEEAAGLARADIVLAIKDSEAAAFRRLGARSVITLPFTLPGSSGDQPTLPHADETTTRRIGPLRAGFIGADNRVNAASLTHFLSRMAQWRSLFLPDLEIVVAGRVCRHVTELPGAVRCLGPVRDVAAFYAGIDVAVVPIGFSTGMKIKVAEALAIGMPVVATADAFDGFAPADPFHRCADIDAVCAALVALAAAPARLSALADASRRVAADTHAAAAAGWAQLWQALPAHRPTCVFVSDIAWWRRQTVMEERCHQTLEFIARSLPVVAVALAATRPDAEAHRAIPGVQTVWGGKRRAGCSAQTLAPFTENTRVAVRWIATARDATGLSESADGVVIHDHWPAAAAGRLPTGRCRHDVLADRLRVNPVPLRYLPPRLPWRGDVGRKMLVVLIEHDATDPAEAASLRPALVEALRAGMPGRAVAVVRSTGIATDTGILDRLAALPTPAAIATIAMAPLAREIVDCLGRCCGAAMFHIACGDYPVLHPGRFAATDSLTLIAEPWAHLAALVDFMDTKSPAPTLASDTTDDAGWSLLRQRLKGGKPPMKSDAATV